MYIPLGQVPETPKEVLQIKNYPEYPEAGVRYERYAKRAVSNGQYKLINQSTRYWQIIVNDGAAGDHIYARPEASTKIFYCTYAIIQISRSAGIFPSALYISDVNGTAAAVRIPFRENNNQINTYFLDFSSCPREFSGNGISVYVQSSVTAPDEIAVTAFGFDEDR